MADLDKLLENLKQDWQQKQVVKSPRAMNQPNPNSKATDDLLAEIKADFDSNKNKKEAKPLKGSASKNVEPMADLLAEVRAQFDDKKEQQLRRSTISAEEVGNLLSEVETQFSGRKEPDSQRSSSSGSTNSLAEIQAKFEEKRKATKSYDYEESALELRLEEQKKQRQRRVLTHRAQEWLKNLNPLSEEGMWFEEFADSYPSPLEAAIEYLAALE